MSDQRVKHLETQLRNKEFMLNSMLEITSAINANQDVEKLIQLYSFILREQLGYSRFMLFIKQEDWKCVVKTGVRSKSTQIDVERDLLRFSDITAIASSQSEVLGSFDLVIPVVHQQVQLAFLLVSGDIQEDWNIESGSGRVNFIQTLTNIIVVAIENKRLVQHSVVQARIKKELEVASEMQRLLFPSDLPSNRKMDISAKYIPRHEVGGDYYDFIPLGDEEYMLCIADVSGKGIGAALLMANFQATIRTLFKYHRFDLEFLIEELNKKVMRSAKGEKFITFFIAHYNGNTRELKYVNAGHNHPFITNGRKVEMLSEGCIGLGMLDELPFISVGRKLLKPNTTIVLYTDGVVELENSTNTFFGQDQLIRLVHSFYPLKMEDMNNLIFSKLDEWREDLPLVDDTAVFCCRIF
jgi:sigma-B regulation protein RsbU (phosphoserine phosphatase)